MKHISEDSVAVGISIDTLSYAYPTTNDSESDIVV
jgi:hypothetical protein